MTFQETKTDLRNPLLPSLTSHHQGNTAWSPIHYGPLYVSKNTNLTACTYPQLGLPCSSFFPLQLFPHKPQCYLAVKNMKKKQKISPPPRSNFLSHIEKILQSNRALLSYVWASISTFRFVHVLYCQQGKVKAYIYSHGWVWVDRTHTTWHPINV